MMTFKCVAYSTGRGGIYARRHYLLKVRGIDQGVQGTTTKESKIYITKNNKIFCQNVWEEKYQILRVKRYIQLIKMNKKILLKSVDE